MAENTIQGRGASPGVARGLTVSILSRNAKGILLVPALTREASLEVPKEIGAVIAGAGGVGSHGAALLREKNIPCVILAPEHFKKLREGQSVRVDGARGLVSLDENETLDRIESIGLQSGGIRKVPLAIPRPDRSYQKLRFDLLRRGWEQSPMFLFGMEECRLSLGDDGVIRVLDGPNTEDIVKFILHNGDWVFAMAGRRELDIDRIKATLPNHLVGVNSSSGDELLRTLDALHELYTTLLRYIYLTQFVAETLLSGWLDLGEQISGDTSAYIQGFLRCEYTQLSLAEGDYPGRSTFWTLPSRDPKVWQGSIRWSQASEDDSYFLRAALFRSLVTRSPLLGQFGQCRLIVPLLYQMTEEHFFVSSSISTFMNRGIDRASRLIFGGDGCEARNEIYTFSYEALITALKGRTSESSITDL